MTKLLQSELPQTIRWEQVPTGGCDVVVKADPAALDALTKRMGIEALLGFTCNFSLKRGAGRVVLAEGHLEARAVLTCVVTLEPFETVLAEDFDLHFVPAGELQDQPDPNAIDEVPYEDGVLAIGEAAAEQLALSLPAFPRGPDAGLLLENSADPSIIDPIEADAIPLTPFAALAARRKPV
jgi:uncharacterized metal-binding protein YceD (DUF177 family)